MNHDPHLTARALGENLPDSPPLEPSPADEAEITAIRDLADEIRDAFRIQQTSDYDLGESRTQALQLILQSARPSRPVTFLRTAGWVSLGAAAAIALGLFVRIDTPTGSTPLAEAVYDPFFALESIERIRPVPAITESPLRSLSSPGIASPRDPQTSLPPPQLADFQLADFGFSWRNLPRLPELPLLEEFTQDSEKLSSLVLVDYAELGFDQPMLGAASSPAHSTGNRVNSVVPSSPFGWQDPLIAPLLKLEISSINSGPSHHQPIINALRGHTMNISVNSSMEVGYIEFNAENVEKFQVRIPYEMALTHDANCVLEINPRIVSQYQLESHVKYADGSHEITVKFQRRTSDPRRLAGPDLRYQLRSARLTREARSNEIACLSLIDARNQILLNIPLIRDPKVRE